ncbi:MAG: DNA repair protein RadA [Chloroflexota bacterium]
MEKPRTKTIFVCQQCGRESPKWLGRCPNCQEWNSFVETIQLPEKPPSPRAGLSGNPPQELSKVKGETGRRITMPIAEFNRVLGGGLVPGTLVIIGGDPGIGKSTLLLQISGAIAASGGNVVYVSGEESIHQVRLRAQRLGIPGDRLFLLAETSLPAVLGHLEAMSPALVIVDSIQTVYMDDISSAAGSIGQIRECAAALMRWAKPANVPVLISGHVTKDGAIAGPRVLEHVVDVVLYLEGEAFSTFRVLRGVKNRFGSTNEIGVFEMTGEGLKEVDNPSLAFLSEHDEPAIGTAVVPTLEGSRPLLVEIQALTSLAVYPPPRRMANGVDFARLLLITAILGKRTGLKLATQDIVVNVVGGLKVNEPAADLAVALTIASSFRETPLPPRMAVIGELSLTGELRGVPQLDRRVTEAARLGFEKCLVPRLSDRHPLSTRGIQVIQAGTINEALRAGLSRPKKAEDEP